MSVVHLEGGRSRELKPGRKIVVRRTITGLHVSEGHKVIIYEGPNEGHKKAAGDFLPGWYRSPRENAQRHDRALRDNRPKLIVTEPFNVPANRLLVLSWPHEKGTVYARLGPGEWDVGSFKNDWVRWVEVPENASVTLFDHAGFGGLFVQLDGPGRYDVYDYGLGGKVSSIRFELDEWKEVRREIGRELSRRKVGSPISSPLPAHGTFRSEDAGMGFRRFPGVEGRALGRLRHHRHRAVLLLRGASWRPGRDQDQGRDHCRRRGVQDQRPLRGGRDHGRG